MNNLYVRLAAQNIKKHRRSYVPFMLAGVFVAAVSYILNVPRLRLCAFHSVFP